METSLGTVTSPASGKDLEVLRKADEGLGHQVFRLSVVRLGLFMVAALWFAGVPQRLSGGPAHNTISQIRVIEAKLRLGPQALDPITLYLTSPTWERAQDMAELKLLAGQLRQQYSEIFKVRFSLLGTDVEFDLRTVILTCPFWLPIAHVYIQLLRQKRRVIQAIGSAYLRRIPDEQVTPLDRLTFPTPGSRVHAYRAYPGVLVDFLFWLTALALVALLAQMVSGSDVWRYSYTDPILAHLVAASAFYSRAYSNYADGKLRAQAETLFQCVVPEDRFGRIWRRVGEVARSLPARVRPKVSLLIGSVLILLTLVLNTAELGCGRDKRAAEPPPQASEKPAPSAPEKGAQPSPGRTAVSLYRPGYELLSGSADWPLSLFTELKLRVDAEDQFGKAVYFLLLWLGVFSLARTVVPGPGGRWVQRATRVAGRLAAAISLCFVGEFANQYFLYTPVWTVPVAAAWLAWLALGRSASRAARWVRVRNFLVVVFVPLLLANVTYLCSVALALPGLVALYVGTHALTLGYAAERKSW